MVAKETELLPPKRLHYGWIVTGVSLLAVMGAVGFGRFAYTPLLPSMKVAMNLTYTETGLLGTGNFIGYLPFSLLGGLLAFLYGPRLLIAISLVVVGVSMILTGASEVFLFALLMRFLTGVGSVGTNVPVMGLISSWFSPRRRGLGAGILVCGSSLGLISFRFYIPALLALPGGSGWRVAWYALGGATLFLALLSALLLRNHPAEKGLAPIGSPQASLQPGAQKVGRPTLAQMFATWPRLYRLAQLYFLFGFSYVIYLQFFNAYLERERGLAPTASSSFLFLIGLVSVLSGPLWGSVSDRLGRKAGLAIVFGLQGTSQILLAYAHTPGMFTAASLLFGISVWSIPSIMAAAAADQVGPRLAPAGLGFITVVFGIGQALGPALAGYLADFTGTFVTGFLIASVAGYLGMVGSLTLKIQEE